VKAQGSADIASRIPLGPEDRAILALECETVAGHTCKVMRLGPNGPSVAALREGIAARIHLTPALLWKLSDSLTAPAWEPDPDFDLARHVVEHRHRRPVSPEGLLTCVARLFEQRLDRSRPLWQLDVIELEQDERALVWRIHHSLADGTTSVRYARALLWDDSPEQTMTPAQTVAQHVSDDARRRRHLAGYLRREFKRSRARSPFDGAIGSGRGVGFATAPLSALHDAAKAIDGASLNDAVPWVSVADGGAWPPMSARSSGCEWRRPRDRGAGRPLCHREAGSERREVTLRSDDDRWDSDVAVQE
jgi:hypothetical protein